METEAWLIAQKEYFTSHYHVHDVFLIISFGKSTISKKRKKSFIKNELITINKRR